MTLITSLCLICNADNTASTLAICSSCLHELPHNTHTCQQCGLQIKDSKSTHCGKCQHEPPAYNETTTPYIYDNAIKHLIIELKFKKKLINAHLLGTLLARSATHKPRPDFLLPVPLHRNRLRTRGFNQAMELCRVLSKELSIPILTDIIEKTQETTPQSKLTAKQRKTNLRGSLILKKEVSATRIAIVDDVITTGTTINEIAKLLRKSGTKNIQAWACARAL